MSYSKEIRIGSAGKLVISEAAGEASVKVVWAEQAGGGKLAGFAKAALSAEVDVDGKVLIDVGFELAKSKYPGAAALIEAAKLAVDAEIGKL